MIIIRCWFAQSVFNFSVPQFELRPLAQTIGRRLLLNIGVINFVGRAEVLGKGLLLVALLLAQGFVLVMALAFESSCSRFEHSEIRADLAFDLIVCTCGCVLFCFTLPKGSAR